MIAPALPRWVAAQLADAVTGINVRRLQVPRGLTDAAPPEVAIYNAIDDDWVARDTAPEQLAPELWVLQVNVAEEIELAGNPAPDGPIEDTAIMVVQLAGVTADGGNADALAHAHRLMRAVRRVLLEAFATLGMDDLYLEGQSIRPPSTMNLQTQELVAGSGAITLALFLPFTITDTWALGAEES